MSKAPPKLPKLPVRTDSKLSSSTPKKPTVQITAAQTTATKSAVKSAAKFTAKGPAKGPIKGKTPPIKATDIKNPSIKPRKQTSARKRREAWMNVLSLDQLRMAPEADARLLQESHGRSRWLAVGLALFMVALVLRAGWLTTVPDSTLEERGAEQFRAAVEMKGQRGALYDRNNRALAMTVSLPTLYANPSRMPAAELERRAADIAAVVGHSERWVREQFARTTEDGRPLQEIRLGDGLEPTASRALVAGLGRDVMWLKEEPIRFYPGKNLGAPLIGFVDAMGNGQAGLERVLEPELSGETYRVLLSQDRKGRSIDAGRDDNRLAIEGHSVRLTIDAAIQHAAEKALDAAMVRSAPEAAMAVVMDIHDGSVLAIASRPSGNPNDGESLSDQNLFKNRAAMDQVEPGSVMKPFVVAAALEEGLVTPETMVDCEVGSWSIGGRTIRDDHPKGVISVTEVVKYSSNIGTAKIGFMLGAQRMLTYLKDFGFGRSTGLGLPGERPGSMRSAATIRTIEMATTSFGQGVTASPIQLAAAMATLANGGLRMMPRIVDAVLDRNGDVETRREPRADRQVISAETARIISDIMVTVSEEGGTGTRARVKGYQVAGKTGTAQKVEHGVYSPTKRVSSYIGYLPADRPEIAIAVVVDTPTIGSKYGGIVSAPVFADIGTFAMEYLGIEPDPEPTDAKTLASDTLTSASPDAAAPLAPVSALEPSSAANVAANTSAATESASLDSGERDSGGPPEVVLLPALHAEGGWVLPDLTGLSMRDVLPSLQAAGLALQLNGYGVVVEQSPAPGAVVTPGTEVVLHFE